MEKVLTRECGVTTMPILETCDGPNVCFPKLTLPLLPPPFQGAYATCIVSQRTVCPSYKFAGAGYHPPQGAEMKRNDRGLSVGEHRRATRPKRLIYMYPLLSGLKCWYVFRQLLLPKELGQIVWLLLPSMLYLAKFNGLRKMTCKPQN